MVPFRDSVRSVEQMTWQESLERAMAKFREYSCQKYSLASNFGDVSVSQSCDIALDFNQNQPEDPHIYQQIEPLPRAIPTYLEKRELPCQEKTFKAVNKKRSKPTYLACHVCGDSAPNHCHYGGIACFSCRAFFRRSVPKAPSYACTSPHPCVINVNTRKNCQKCRFEKCVATGMKASWVLSDEEKLTRLEKKRQNKESRKLGKPRRADSVEYTDNGSDSSFGSRPSSHESYDSYTIPTVLGRRSTSKGTNHQVTNQESLKIDLWRKTGDEICSSMDMSENILKGISLTGQIRDTLETSAIVEFFKVQYSRAAKFANSTDVFRALSENSKKVLLSKNLDMLSTINLAAFVDEDLSFSPRLFTTNVHYRLPAIRVEQVFAEPWAKNEAHRAKFIGTITKTARHLRGDEKAAVVFQLVALFHSYGLDDAQLEDKDEIERTQASLAELLHRLLSQGRGNQNGRRSFCNLMAVLHDLRDLACTLTDDPSF